jgi:hypothetical protein
LGVSRSFAELNGKLRAAETNLKRAEKPAVTAGGKVAERTFMGVAVAQGAAGKRGVTVRNTTTNSNGHPAQLVKFGPNPGWVKIMEGFVGPHFIGPTGKGRGGSLRRQNTRKGSRRAIAAGVASMLGGPIDAKSHGVINLGGGIGPKAWAFHKGIHKKKLFVATAQRLAPPLASAEMRKVAVTSFTKSFL